MIDMKRTFSLLLTVCLVSINSFAYGPRGHHLVGAIADRRLAKNKAVAKKVRRLLDGLTLQQVATFPDEIKSWDKCKQQTPEQVTTDKRIRNELRAFVNANKCNSDRYHGNFHFTDVPIFDGKNYENADVGREPFDIVQTINFCVRVLKGEEPQTNDRKITKTVAVILLAHYFGDIHQPLHVGAEYFDGPKPFKPDGPFTPFDPSPADKGFADQGGNKLTLFTFVGNTLTPMQGNFHSYWDSTAVNNALAGTSDIAEAKKLSAAQPANWKLNGDPETWAEQMADDILPLAREAHQRLEFEKIVVASSAAHDITSGNAKEIKTSSGKPYAKWSAGVVESEIQKGGWRLAALLEAVLQ